MSVRGDSVEKVTRGSVSRVVGMEAKRVIEFAHTGKRVMYGRAASEERVGRAFDCSASS
jgi:hypothetical protein